MLKALGRPWFKARTLSVLQLYYDQPFRNPLSPLHKRMLDGAVRLTMDNGGTPFDAATRFYAAFAEQTVGIGADLNTINFAGVLGRMWTLRDKLKFYDEHVAALKQVSASDQSRNGGAAP